MRELGGKFDSRGYGLIMSFSEHVPGVWRERTFAGAPPLGVSAQNANPATFAARAGSCGRPSNSVPRAVDSPSRPRGLG